MDSDWADDPQAQEFLRHALEEMLPALKDSALTISLMPRGEDPGDAKYWVELGASIMLEKPILLVVEQGSPIPQKLQKVADEIVMVTDDLSAHAEELEAAIKRMLGDD